MEAMVAIHPEDFRNPARPNDRGIPQSILTPTSTSVPGQDTSAQQRSSAQSDTPTRIARWLLLIVVAIILILLLLVSINSKGQTIRKTGLIADQDFAHPSQLLSGFPGDLSGAGSELHRLPDTAHSSI